MAYTVPSRVRPKPIKRRHPALMLVLVVAGLLVAAGVLLFLHHTGSLPFWRNSVPAVTSNSNAHTKAEPAANPPANGSPASNGSPGNQGTEKSNPPATGVLVAPWGTFANNYNAKLGDQMQSTCNTSPGATCQIIFTNGDQSKSLDQQPADAGGAVYWSWSPQQVGLTPGTWHITAQAVLGSQIKTTNNDPLTLQVHA